MSTPLTMLTLVGSLAVALALVKPVDSAQDAPAQPAAVAAITSLDLPLTELKDRRQEFEYRISKPDSAGPPEPAGSVVLSTKIAGGTFSFADRGDVEYGGQTNWIEMNVHGAIGNELRPDHLSVRGTTGEPDGKTFEYYVDFTASAAAVTFNGTTNHVAVPAGTICFESFYRLGPLLPRRAGFVASFEHYLDANQMVVEPGGTISCVSATETVEVAGKAVKTFRFDATSGDHVFFSMWVDDTGRLMQTCLDGMKWLVAKA